MKSLFLSSLGGHKLLQLLYVPNKGACKSEFAAFHYGIYDVPVIQSLMHALCFINTAFPSGYELLVLGDQVLDFFSHSLYSLSLGLSSAIRPQGTTALDKHRANLNQAV